MTKTTDTATQAKQLEARIIDLQAKLADAKPKARGIYTTKIRIAQEQLTALAAGARTVEQVLADAKANNDAERSALRAKRQAKPDPKPAAKKGRKLSRKAKDAAIAKVAAEVASNAALAPRESVWQERVNAAVDALNGGAESAPLHECPTPKTATGTADKVRKMIASGKLSVPVAITVKSHGPYVEARLA